MSAVADTADVKAFHNQRIIAQADDEFGRTTADVDHQPLPGVGRHRMRGPGVDQARFLAPGDHFDRKPQRVFRLAEKISRILGHAQRVGCHSAHMIGVEIAQPFAEALQGRPAACLRSPIEIFVPRQPRSKAYRLAQRIDGIDLATAGRVFDTPHDQAEAVGAQVDGREKFWMIDHTPEREMSRLAKRNIKLLQTLSSLRENFVTL